ncbi:MAG: hypothetical protein OQK51_21270, partial [Kangiellaceae bacterium]|nr:hypothetical protein [Kangiellaceae bacterium]
MSRSFGNDRLKKLFKNRHMVIFLLIVIASLPIFPVKADNQWTQIIRNLPYSYSKNFHKNLSAIRRWVLFGQGFCEQNERHILFNVRGQFLGYAENLSSQNYTQQHLNQVRSELFKSNKVGHFVAGAKDSIGYPFALNCNQPHANFRQSLARMLGNSKQDRLWGTWDGISAGTKSTPINLVELVDKVYRVKSATIKQPVKPLEFRYFLAQIIIESGARKNGLSRANAIGLMQLKPEVLNDCQIPPRFYRHRMAQVDCAVRLFQQNRRNLQPVFKQLFDHLPLTKKNRLFSLLLIQSYHSGIGRMSRLLSDASLNKASVHFAQNHANYSAEDIASGIIFHNQGRQELGLASLYYAI